MANEKASVLYRRWGKLPVFAGAHPAEMVFLIVLALIATTVEGLGLVLVYPILEVMRTGEDPASLAEKTTAFRYVVETFRFVGIPPTLGWMMSATVCLVVLRQALMYWSAVTRGRFSHEAVSHISVHLFKALIRADLQVLEQQRSGTLLNALTTEARRAAMLALAMLNVIVSILKMVIFAILMLMLSWQATLVGAGIVGVLGVLISRGLIRRSRSAGSRLSEANDALSRFASERLRLFRLLKLARSQDIEASMFSERAWRVSGLNVDLAKAAAHLTALIEPCGVIIAVTALYVASQLLGMGLAEIGVFVLIMFRLMPVVQELAANLQLAASYRASLTYIDGIIAEAEQNAEKDDAPLPFPRPLRQGIRLENVCYRYVVGEENGGEMPQALSDVSLLLPAGKTIALLGPSGAGKSTLIDLLPGLKRPTSGAIFFDEISADQIKLSDLRGNMAMVSQDILVIDGTVADNLRYGNPSASDDDVRQAARDACADGFIQALPQGYETVLGERGARLSGGQRQRIALARAFLSKVPVLLLDEPTSALDAESEQAVQQALERLQREHGTTIVIIAHRLSTVSHADLTVVLDKGRVLACGTHQELMQSTSWYQKVVELQSSHSSESPSL